MLVLENVASLLTCLLITVLYNRRPFWGDHEQLLTSLAATLSGPMVSIYM